MKKDETKTKEQLIDELIKMRQRVAVLEAAEVEHKPAETIPLTADENYQRLFELVPIGATMLDMKGMILFCNSTVYNQAGYPEGEFTGKHFSKIAPIRVKDIPTYIRIFNSIVRGKTPKPFEAIYQRKDGKSGCTELSIGLIKAGGKQRILVMQHDITERKQAEERMGQAAKEWRTTFDSISDMVSIHNRESRVMRVNKAFASTFQMEPQEVIGRTCYELVHGTQRPLESCPHQRVLDTGEPSSGEFTVPHLGACMEGTCSPIFDVRGEITSTVHVMHDITERKQAEEEIQKFKTVIDNAIYGVAIDALGGILSYVNESFARMHGYTPDELVGKHYSVLYTDEQKLVVDKLRDWLGQVGSFICEEIWHKRKDGSLFPTLMTGNLIRDDRGNPSYIVGSTIDITERMQAEEEIMRFKTVADTAGYGIAIGPLEKLGYVNRAFAEMHGYSPDELIGQHYSILYTREQLPVINRLRDQLSEGGSFVGEEVWHKKKDGTVFPTLMTGNSIRDTAGNPYFIAGTVIDITERKQAEEEIRKFKVIADSAGYGVAIGNPDGELLYVNKALAQMQGYTPEELVGKHFSILYPEESAKQVAKLRNRLVQTGSFTAQEIWRKRKDGTVFPSLMTGTVTRDNQGNPRYVSSTAVDITERKKAEEALRESEERYRSIIDLGASFNEAIAMTQDTEQGTAIHVYANEEWSRITGYSNEELIGSSYMNVIHPKYRMEVLDRYNRRLKGEVLPLTYELSVLKKDGAEVPIEAVGSFTTYRGKPAAVSYFRDITDRKQAEEEIRKSHAALRNLSAHQQNIREEERTSVAREIHDELGQSLTALKMDLSWLTRRLPTDGAPLLEKTASMLKLVDTTIGTVKRIITRLRPGILDDLGLIAALEWQAGEFQEHTGIKTRLDLPAELTDLDRGCATAFFRIFQEALTNISRHSGATKVKISLQEKDGQLSLKIEDNGIGITEEQINNPRSFGLIGIRERIYSQGGEASIRGNEGKGTVLKVSCQLSRKEKEHDKNTHR